ncbi:MAG: hypothetical protein JRH20_03925 [Deltaproteobacteria bacterium]|nr:hypothetical protein [Deltaproteobacteria bacterium]
MRLFSMIMCLLGLLMSACAPDNPGVPAGDGSRFLVVDGGNREGILWGDAEADGAVSKDTTHTTDILSPQVDASAVDAAADAQLSVDMQADVRVDSVDSVDSIDSVQDAPVADYAAGETPMDASEREGGRHHARD